MHATFISFTVFIDSALSLPHFISQQLFLFLSLNYFPNVYLSLSIVATLIKVHDFFLAHSFIYISSSCWMPTPSLALCSLEDTEMNETRGPWLWGIHRLTDHFSDLFPAHAQIYSVHNARLLFLQHHQGYSTHLFRLTAESLMVFKVLSDLAPIYLSGFIFSSSKCSLCSAKMGYLPLCLPMIVCSLSSTFLLECSLQLSSALYVPSSRLPYKAVLVISCIRVLLEGVEWWQKSRLPSRSCASAVCILIHTGTLYELALSWRAA